MPVKKHGYKLNFMDFR